MEDAVVNGITLADALAVLNSEQLYVIAGYYWDGRTDLQLALELTLLRGKRYSWNRVKRIRRTALEKMRREEAVAA